MAAILKTITDNILTDILVPFADAITTAWILATGNWDDAGAWDDTAEWKDAP